MNDTNKFRRSEIELTHYSSDVSAVVITANLLFKWAILGLFFVYFPSFSNNRYTFYNNLMYKMAIQ